MTVGDVTHIRTTLDYLIFRQIQLEHKVMAKLDNITASIEKMTNAGDGMKELLTTLNDELKTALANDDTPALQALSSKIDAKTEEWIEAAQANTQPDPAVQTQG